jgi:hypothetical protein
LEKLFLKLKNVSEANLNRVSFCLFAFVAESFEVKCKMCLKEN